MTRTRSHTSSLVDRPVDVKLRLSGLWTAMLFVFAYVDIFGFWRADSSTAHWPVVSPARG